MDTWRFVRNGRSFEVGVRSRLTVNNAAALMRAALTGFGIVFVAEDLARDAPVTGNLVRVLPNYETPSRPMHLLYHPDRRPPTADRRPTPKLRSFIDTVLEQFGPSSEVMDAIDQRAILGRAVLSSPRVRRG